MWVFKIIAVLNALMISAFFVFVIPGRQYSLKANPELLNSDISLETLSTLQSGIDHSYSLTGMLLLLWFMQFIAFVLLYRAKNK